MSEATATNGEVYEGDKYGAVYGGNVGGRLNNNLIGNTGEASWEEKLKKIRRTVPTLTKLGIHDPEDVVIEVGDHIKSIREALTEFKTLLGPDEHETVPTVEENELAAIEGEMGITTLDSERDVTVNVPEATDLKAGMDSGAIASNTTAAVVPLTKIVVDPTTLDDSVVAPTTVMDEVVHTVDEVVHTVRGVNLQ